MISAIVITFLFIAPVMIWPRYWLAVALALLFFASGASLVLSEPENAATILRQQIVTLPVTTAFLSAIVFLRKRFPIRPPQTPQ